MPTAFCSQNTTAKSTRPRPKRVVNTTTMRVGYVRLLDAAPFIVAKELGIFDRCEVRVELSREVGWATIRDKIVYGELQASQATGPLPYAITLGLSCPAKPCKALMVLNRHGNAITLSEDLYKREVTDGITLAQEIHGTRSIKRYVFGVVARHSSHDIILRHWLKSSGIDPDKDVQTVVLPPEQMVRCLASSNIDGFCVGEPWNSLAIRQGIGWSPAASADLHPGHPEKVLMCTEEVAETHHEQCTALVKALLEACAWCDAAENREDLINILCKEHNLNCEAAILRPALIGPFHMGHEQFRTQDDFLVFHRNGANRPSMAHAEWIMNGLRDGGHLDNYIGSDTALSESIFDAEIYNNAVSYSN